jgi:hypothetical protein
MRSGIFIRLLATPMMWVIVVFGVLFFIGFYRPFIAANVQDNLALYLGVALGTIAIVLSAFSEKSRSDFRADFDHSYRQLYTKSRSARDRFSSRARRAFP